jgi:hypothetical protein
VKEAMLLCQLRVEWQLDDHFAGLNSDELRAQRAHELLLAEAQAATRFEINITHACHSLALSVESRA